MAQIIRALLGFTRLADNDLAARALAVLKGVFGKAAFPDPPYTQEAFQACLDAFVHSIPDAVDGSQKAIAEKNKRRKSLEAMLRLLVAYVEVAAGGDLAVFLSSGLEAASKVRASVQPISPASIKKIGQGVSGQLLGFVNAKKGATHYEWRCAAVDGAGVPGPWTSQMTGNARPPVAFNNLTPGTMYAVQVRALGKLGLTEWSPAVSRMVI